MCRRRAVVTTKDWMIQIEVTDEEVRELLGLKPSQDKTKSFNDVDDMMDALNNECRKMNPKRKTYPIKERSVSSP